MLNSLFDNIFLINLDRRPDRLEVCDTWFKANDIQYERIAAVDGNAINGEYSREASNLGCTSSHLNVLRLSEERGYDKIVVLEDDFDPVDNFVEKMFEAYPHVPEWDQLYFGGNHQFPLGRINPFISSTAGTATTHAYAIKRSIFPQVFEMAKNFSPIDTAYRLLHPRIKAYSFTPHLINQKTGFSDIVNQEINYDFMR